MKLILGIVGQPKTVNCAGAEHVIQAVSAIVFEPGLRGLGVLEYHKDQPWELWEGRESFWQRKLHEQKFGGR